MKLIFSEQAWEDYLYWQKIEKKLLQRINDLIKEITRTPHTGTGKPEPLKHALAGAWSRRITEEHRLVYLPTEGELIILQARYRYED